MNGQQLAPAAINRGYYRVRIEEWSGNQNYGHHVALDTKGLLIEGRRERRLQRDLFAVKIKQIDYEDAKKAKVDCRLRGRDDKKGGPAFEITGPPSRP